MTGVTHMCTTGGYLLAIRYAALRWHQNVHDVRKMRQREGTSTEAQHVLDPPPERKGQTHFTHRLLDLSHTHSSLADYWIYLTRTAL
jgi:hypothetical protein